MKTEEVKEILFDSGIRNNSIESRFPYTYHHDYRRTFCPTSRADEAQRFSLLDKKDPDKAQKELMYLALIQMFLENCLTIGQALTLPGNYKLRKIFTKAFIYAKYYRKEHDPREYREVSVLPA